jgi:PPK2 family polyphosphate:nucleotide phosphotransferase
MYEFVKPFRVQDGTAFNLKNFDPSDTRGLKSKEHAHEILAKGVARLTELQEKLYAQDRWAVLVLLQGMDAAGKDSTVKHVMSGMNPLACTATAFKVPSPEELQHDYLWRTARFLPPRGSIGIFNRSYYEEVLAVRVHPEAVKCERLPKELVTEKIWQERYEDINAHEHYLSRNGVIILKFFLNLSKEKQKDRFLKRLDEPEKNWKFQLRDVQERRHWDDYMRAYEKMVQQTSTGYAPWHVVPADHKWFAHLVVAEVIISALDKLDLSFPKLGAERREELKKARVLLKSEE